MFVATALSLALAAAPPTPALEGSVVLRPGAQILLGATVVTPQPSGPAWSARVVSDDGEWLEVTIRHGSCVPTLPTSGPLADVHARVRREDLLPLLAAPVSATGPQGTWRLDPGVVVLQTLPTGEVRVAVWSDRGPLLATAPGANVTLAWSHAAEPTFFNSPTTLHLRPEFSGLRFDDVVEADQLVCGRLEPVPDPKRTWPADQGGVSGGVIGGVVGGMMGGMAGPSTPTYTSTHPHVMSWRNEAPTLRWADGTVAGQIYTNISPGSLSSAPGRLCAQVDVGDVPGALACADPTDLVAGGLSAVLPEGHGLTDVTAALDAFATCVIPLRQREGGMASTTLPWPSKGAKNRPADSALAQCWAALPELAKGLGTGTVTLAAGAWPTR